MYLKVQKVRRTHHWLNFVFFHFVQNFVCSSSIMPREYVLEVVHNSGEDRLSFFRYILNLKGEKFTNSSSYERDSLAALEGNSGVPL